MKGPALPGHRAKSWPLKLPTKREQCGQMASRRTLRSRADQAWWLSWRGRGRKEPRRTGQRCRVGELIYLVFRKECKGIFLGCSVVRTVHFHVEESGVGSSSGNWDPTSHVGIRWATVGSTFICEVSPPLRLLSLFLSTRSILQSERKCYFMFLFLFFKLGF